mmetsp:Transcript_234/g.308  ORF Transcript_234/g.308 Transcript_234/m.308 type:complete len:88 (+) Transcript_234:205-468(+)
MASSISLSATIAAARSTARLASRSSTYAATLAVRHLTGGAGPAKVSVDHYASGWKIDDIADWSKHGKYHIQTFNKISDKVSVPYSAV